LYTTAKNVGRVLLFTCHATQPGVFSRKIWSCKYTPLTSPAIHSALYLYLNGQSSTPRIGINGGVPILKNPVTPDACRGAATTHGPVIAIEPTPGLGAAQPSLQQPARCDHTEGEGQRKRAALVGSGVAGKKPSKGFAPAGATNRPINPKATLNPR